MIIFALIKFNKEKLNNWNLIFKYIKKEAVFRIIILITSVILMVSGLIMKNFYLLSVLIIYIILLFNTNSRIRHILSVKHNVIVKQRTSWEPLTNYKVKQLKIFLKDRKVLSKENIEGYIKYLEKEAENFKFTNYFRFWIPGLFLVLFIPVWNNFNSWYMNNMVNNFNSALMYILSVVLLILLIIFIFGTTKDFFKEFFETKTEIIKI